MTQFDQQCVVVTGSGQGIGRATAYTFAQKKASVIIADIDVEAGLEATAFITNEGGKAIFVEADVSSAQQVQTLMEKAVSTYGRMDVLVNNTGIGHSESIFTCPPEAFERVLAVNLTGSFLCAKYAAMVMKEQGKGSIINIASTRALMSEAHTESYSASKGGILALTHSLAVSLGPYGIRVNAISPGWIDTAEWRKSDKAYSPQHSKKDREQHPAMRVGHPLDIAKAVVYLASEDAGFITGQNIVIDGGMTIKMIYE
jgi:NAD(P)-dependent dehydrogenase (short-subunit alcohol dehydrogenase family)